MSYSEITRKTLVKIFWKFHDFLMVFSLLWDTIITSILASGSPFMGPKNPLYVIFQQLLTTRPILDLISDFG